MSDWIGTLQAPTIPAFIPDNSQWLSGQGTGTWFSIAPTSQKDNYLIKRFSPEGNLECDRIFKIEQNDVMYDISEPYQFTHISHCSKCRIIQNGITFVFNYLPPSQEDEIL